MAERKNHDVKWFFACGKPWYKKWWVIVLIVIMLIAITLIAIILIAIPSMIDDAYMRGLTLTEPNTTFTSSDLLSFYGSFLAFIGTVFLGALALYQNSKFKKQNDISQSRLEKMNVDLLNLQAQKTIPIFEISNLSVKSSAQKYKAKLITDSPICRFDVFCGQGEVNDNSIVELELGFNLQNITQNYISRIEIKNISIQCFSGTLETKLCARCLAFHDTELNCTDSRSGVIKLVSNEKIETYDNIFMCFVFESTDVYQNKYEEEVHISIKKAGKSFAKDIVCLRSVKKIT